MQARLPGNSRLRNYYTRKKRKSNIIANFVFSGILKAAEGKLRSRTLPLLSARINTAATQNPT